MDSLDPLFAEISQLPWARLTLPGLALLLAAWAADRVTRLLLVRAIRRLVRATPTQWDDALLARGVINHLAHAVPAVVIYLGIAIIPELPGGAATVIRNVAAAYLVLTLAQALAALMDAALEQYERSDPVRARNRPIKGYIQVTKLVLFLISAVLIISVLIERSPLLLLSGLGAMTAVLLLVFKDTLLSLVASVQLSSNDMVRVGDWIEMPQLGADGDVVDIALHSVKVQNWDKSITTIPTQRLISESFRNWRGMSEAGGRRIKRSLSIDQNAIRYLNADEQAALHRIELLRPYLERKQQEIDAWNAQRHEHAPVNWRRLTNIGCLRAYADVYLAAHPGIHPNMTRLVRQLPPGPQGLPIELYCFTRSTDWGDYEALQADLFDHLLAILPEFGLRVFQSPTGGDMNALVSAMRRD